MSGVYRIPKPRDLLRAAEGDARFLMFAAACELAARSLLEDDELTDAEIERAQCMILDREDYAEGDEWDPACLYTVLRQSNSLATIYPDDVVSWVSRHKPAA